MRSSLPGRLPSFLRRRLTWTSTLRSKEFKGRPSATSAICSRVTTLPALRNKSSSTLNSTEVSSDEIVVTGEAAKFLAQAADMDVHAAIEGIQRASECNFGNL